MTPPTQPEPPRLPGVETANFLGPRVRAPLDIKVCETPGCANPAYQSWKRHRETGGHKAAVRAEKRARQGDTTLARMQREGLL